jgi:hypothetical protein
MFRSIVALVISLLFLVFTKKKSVAKRAVRSSRKLNPKRDRTRAKGKQIAHVPASKKPMPQQAIAPEQVKQVAQEAPKLSAPIQAPALFSPRPGEFAESLTPSFRWFYVGSASHYELVWSLDARFHKAHILLTNQTLASLPPEQALVPGVSYVWRVRGGNDGGWGPWSEARAFTTPEE